MSSPTKASQKLNKSASIVEAPLGAAYHLVESVYRQSPGQSWRRLNAALQHALDTALLAHLPFSRNDFRAIAHDFNGSYWMGRSTGSALGERYYRQAVELNHTSACQSFEAFAGRPPALWPERAKTAARLAVGSEFTWEGETVTVTSLNTEHLVACSYGPQLQSSEDDLTIGALVYLHGGARPIEQVGHNGASVTVRFGAPVPMPGRVPKKVHQITYDELTRKRKEADARQKEVLASIAQAVAPGELAMIETCLTERIRAGQFRHFDIEELREALDKAKVKAESSPVAQETRLARWMAGEAVPGLFEEVRLRVKDGRVQTSTGQSVSIASAQQALRLLQTHGRKSRRLLGQSLDGHEIRRITDTSLIVGCTAIPWSEIDRITPELTA